VSLFKDKIEQGWVNSCPVIKVRSFCCTRGLHRVTVQRQDCLWTVIRFVPLVQQKRLTFITAHEFTQPCSILSLNSDTMAALEASIVSLFKDKIEQGWVNSCAVIKVRSFCCTRGTNRVTVQRQDWTRLSACSILSLNSDTMCAPRAAETSYLYESTWVHSALFNLVFEQWHDWCP
jgi:hypothetical protein